MVFSWLSSLFSQGEEAPPELYETILMLDEIGTIRNELPINQRGWLFELGLYVLKRKRSGMTRLEAGSHVRRSAIDLWREHPWEPYRVRKYQGGEWENLVLPSLTLAGFLYRHNGLPDHHMAAFKNAVQNFKRTGEFHAPDSEPKVSPWLTDCNPPQ